MAGAASAGITKGKMEGTCDEEEGVTDVEPRGEVVVLVALDVEVCDAISAGSTSTSTTEMSGVRSPSLSPET